MKETRLHQKMLSSMNKFVLLRGSQSFSVERILPSEYSPSHQFSTKKNSPNDDSLGELLKYLMIRKTRYRVRCF